MVDIKKFFFFAIELLTKLKEYLLWLDVLENVQKFRLYSSALANARTHIKGVGILCGGYKALDGLEYAMKIVYILLFCHKVN